MIKLSKLIISFSLIFVFNSSYCQNKSFDNMLHLGGNVLINKEVNARTATAQLIMFPENKFSLLYSVGIGVTQENKFFAHFPLGCFFAGYLFGYSDGENNDLLTSLAILSVVIPEGICYNLNIGNRLRVSPYINFNSVEYYRIVGGNEKIKPSCELGSKISYFSKNNIGCSFF